MRLADITVEVRDKSLTRLGLIRPEELDLEVQDRHNNVGTWTLRLAAEHPLAPVLRQPGAGIIVTGPGDVLLSGPTVKPENAATVGDPSGTVTIEGVDDTVLLADALAYPEPSNGDPVTQKQANDERRGPVESLMHAFVAANIGPTAPTIRRDAALLARLTMGVDLGRGPVTTKSARFKVLGNLLAELATVADLGFRIVQRGGVLVFETHAVADRTAEIRLDILNNTLAGHKVATSPPGATQVIVAGQQEGVNRRFVHRTNAEAVAAQRVWGRRIERFVDQRNTDKIEELEQAGDEVLADEGFATLAVQVVPMDDTAIPFGTRWGLGDRVAVVVENQELASTVTGYLLKADADGVRLGALIGDTTGFDPQAALGRRVGAVESRVSSLEQAGKGGALVSVADLDEVYSTDPAQLVGGESLHYTTYPDGDAVLPGAVVQSFKAPGGHAAQMWHGPFWADEPGVSVRMGAGQQWSKLREVAFGDDLQALAAELGNRPTVTDTSIPLTSWNDIATTGYYQATSASIPGGPPVKTEDTTFLAHCIALTPNWAVVVAWDLEGNTGEHTRQWMRRKRGGVWEPWFGQGAPSWTDITTFGTGVTRDGNNWPRVAIVDAEIRYRGRLNLAAGMVNGGALCTVAPAFRPATSQPVSAACAQVSGGQGVCRIDVNANGTISMFFSGALPGWVDLSAVRAWRNQT